MAKHPVIAWLFVLSLAVACKAPEDPDRSCPRGSDGCICLMDATCDDALTCDRSTLLCRATRSCKDLDCADNQACTPARPGVDAQCRPACVEGWSWVPSTSRCVASPDHCGASGMRSIADRCSAENRECVEWAGGARCGVCLEGFGEVDGGPCQARAACEADDVAECEGQGRLCLGADPGSGVSCGGCLPGWVNVVGECHRTTCAMSEAPGAMGATCAADKRECVADDAAGAQCGDCFAGHAPPAGGEGACVEIPTCEALACWEAHRACDGGGEAGGAVCGACLAGFAEQGATCVAVAGALCGDVDGSVEADCAAEGRTCDDDGPDGAVCGVCLDGLVEHPALRTCGAPVGCEALDCAGQGRACDEDPTAQCTECLDGLVEDDRSGGCREPLSCEDIDCWDWTCAPAPQGADEALDARCVSPCPDTWLWNGQRCVPCPACDDAAAGEDGVDPRPSAAGWCVCRTLPGWFFSTANEAGVAACDADGDGWVRESARVVLDSGDPVLVDNARCDVREIDRFVLHNDSGQERTVPLEQPLPLYESVRNDDDGILAIQWEQAGLPRDAWGPDGDGLAAAALNPLTKLCSDPLSDFNDNGVPDVSEYGAHPLPADFRPENRPFNEFSYFAELHRGWYEAPGEGAGIAKGAWHIAERRRDPGFEAGVPVDYRDDVSGYWQDCPRRTDAAADVLDPPVGMDFFSAPMDEADGWRGMNHHSQFKCLDVSNVPDPEHPLSMTRAEADAAYVLNVCVPSGVPIPAGAADPATPRLSCAEPGPDELGVMWGAVPYRAYAPDTRQSGYVRGCADSCGEALVKWALGDPELDCPGLAINRPSCSGDAGEYGRLQCHEVACDGVDNDGDGEIDPVIVEPVCTDGTQDGCCHPGDDVLGICAWGSTACNGVEVVCTPKAAEPFEECNGLDDDCDGTVDEELGGAVGGGCRTESLTIGLPAGDLPGVCGDRESQCIEGQLDCIPRQPFEPEGETLCDGHDNDCDGSVDEGLEGLPVPGDDAAAIYGAPCQLAQPLSGQCAETAWKCVEGEPACASVYPGSNEGCPAGAGYCNKVCDGADNDCDGQTDEDDACLRTWRRTLSLNPLIREDDLHFGGSDVTMNVSLEFGGFGENEITATFTVEALEQYHRPTEAFIEREYRLALDSPLARVVGGNQFSVTYIDGDIQRDTLKAPHIDPSRNPFEPNVQRVDDHDAVVTLDCHGTVDGQDIHDGGGYSASRTGCRIYFEVDYVVSPTPRPPCVGEPSEEVCDGLDNDCDGVVDDVEFAAPQELEFRIGQPTQMGEDDRLIAVHPDGMEQVIFENQLVGWEEIDLGWFSFWIPAGPRNFTVRSDLGPVNGVTLRWEGNDPDSEVLTIESVQDERGRRLRDPDGRFQLTAPRLHGGSVESDTFEWVDSMGLGGACGADPVGPCRKGYTACVDGLEVCVDGVFPEGEGRVCDDVDNDCDGEVDEDVRVDCQTPCGPGTRTCDADTSGAPETWCFERCEQDCEGLVLRTCDPATLRMGGCVIHEAPEERCDGLDNDCDRQTDEDWPEIGDACTSGDGQCARDGSVACTDDGSATQCAALPGQPGDELCDGTDEDCDGAIDEAADLEPPGALEQRGVCAGLEQRCEGARGYIDPSNPTDHAALAAAIGPDYEQRETTCDGQDNDCDGAVDEPEHLDPAPAGALAAFGVCTGAVKVCDDGWQEPDYAVHDARYEAGDEVTCDNADNDCDGARDEDLTRPAANVNGVCQNQRATCTAGVWNEPTDAELTAAIGANYQPGAETKCFDGLDNDCDGLVDRADAVDCPP